MKHLLTVFCLTILTGCATYVPSNAVRSAQYDPKLKNEAVLEAAVDAARESKLPAMSKMDKANGVVEFGAFGMPEMGLTGQARIKPDNYVELTGSAVRCLFRSKLKLKLISFTRT